jgi:Protein of unknown function (DUF3667)
VDLPDRPAGERCLNCSFELTPRRLNFCPLCGQETNIQPPTLREMAQHFAGNYIAAEGALWRTLKLLVLKPGELTREYLAGRRKHYVLPLRLYLTLSLVVLLLLQAVAVVDLGDIEARTAEGKPIRSLVIHFGIGSAGMKEGQYFCQGLPGWLCQRVEQRLGTESRALARRMNASGERLLRNLGGAMFVLLPAFAAILAAVWHRRRLRYTEHLVFALHLHAFWFLMLALVLPGVEWLSLLAGLAVPVYAVLAMRQVYGGRWWLLLPRALAAGLLYSALLGLTMTVLWLWFLLA